MTERFAGFSLRSVRGVPVLFDEDRRFKTLRLVVLVRRPLGSAEDVAARSLLPALLVHGTRRDVDRPAIARRMELLYGAALGPSIGKHGEAQVLRASLDVVAGEFLPGRPPQLEDGLAFLAELLVEPRLAGEAFPAAVFERERRQALDAVRTRVDDRGSHARDEALRLACAGEPHAIPDYGSEAALLAMDAAAPERARRDLLARGEAFVVACGAFDSERLLAAVDSFLARLPERRVEPVGPPVPVAPRAPRRHVDRVPLQQSKFVLVLRFPPSDDPTIWIGRRLFVAMLGGGPQSRLFLQLREKRSLAYYASAGVDRAKGLLLVQVGCDEERAAQVEEETQRQLAELGRGAFEPAELEVARAQMLHALDTVGDAVASRCQFVAENWLLRADRTPQALRAAYLAADRELVMSSAAGLWQDFAYLLAPGTPRP
ncbi:MAG: insulinase family protein [Planctomycetes bacterium]|nr:insulinase family protein [Planctomycetota bacterium]